MADALVAIVMFGTPFGILFLVFSMVIKFEPGEKNPLFKLGTIFLGAGIIASIILWVISGAPT